MKCLKLKLGMQNQRDGDDKQKGSWPREIRKEKERKAIIEPK